MSTQGEPHRGRVGVYISRTPTSQGSPHLCVCVCTHSQRENSCILPSIMYTHCFCRTFGEKNKDALNYKIKTKDVFVPEISGPKHGCALYAAKRPGKLVSGFNPQSGLRATQVGDGSVAGTRWHSQEHREKLLQGPLGFYLILHILDRLAAFGLLLPRRKCGCLSPRTVAQPQVQEETL